ncbi:MAG: putative small heat shock protein [Promethearchaeota archaeon CR_4]|nr:MAG: putative small heat shock protein [Candidatus Lokiarchaeota archaeon CR_4]
MTTTRISPNVCAYPNEEEHEKLHIEVELPGVKKEDIKFKLHEDSFYIRATKGDIEYVGSYAVCCPVKAEDAKAKFVDGLLTVEVPYRDEFAEAVEVAIQ